MNLNEQQQLAVNELNKSMSISAGAGSGKTRVLVERFWNVIESGRAWVNEILTITFTRKAAHELITRVRKRIDESNWNYDQKMLLKESLSRAYIGTIHSFCARLLKENPVEAGVDPNFRVMEEQDGAQLLQQTVEEVVLGQVRIGDPGSLALVELLGYKPLCKELQLIITILNNKGLKINEIQKATNNSFAYGERERLKRVSRINQSLVVIAELLPQVDSKNKTFAAVQEFADHYKEWSICLEQTDNCEDGHLLELLEYLLELCKQLKARVVKDLAAELKQAVEELIGCLMDRQTLSSLKVVFRLLTIIAESYSNNKAKQNVLEFSDLEEKAVELLSNHPCLLQRYQNQFQHIMVDEFQDTNYRQVKLIRLLAGGQQPASLFVVGDPKQSIYRFRGAEVSLFTQISEKIADYGGIKHTLDENYRTREQIIEIINNFFRNLMQKGTSCRFQQLIPWRKNKLLNPQVELHLIEQDSNARLGNAEAEAECLALRIREIITTGQVLVSEVKDSRENMRPVKYGDIALLFRTTRDMDTFAAVFDNYEIPSYIMGSRGFYQTEEIRTLILALQTVENHHDEMALAGLLRSPLFGVSDEALWLMKQAAANLESAVDRLEEIKSIAPDEQDKIRLAGRVVLGLRQLKSRLSLVELMDLLLAKTGFEYSLAMRPNGKQMIANINKFKRLAVSYNHDQHDSLTGFLNFIARMQEADIREQEATTVSENGNTIKMLTVHQAKGLEFPVVIIPETHRKFNFRDTSGFSIVSDEQGLFLKTDNYKGFLRQKAEATETMKLEEEYKRLLYVAMTRACDYLILSGFYKTDSQGLVRSEPNSWLNWLLAEYGIEEKPGTELSEQAGLQVFQYKQADIIGTGPKLANQMPTISEEEIDHDLVNRIIAAVPEHPFRQIISATAIMDYKFCHRYYYLKYLARIPETVAVEEYQGEIIVHNLRAGQIGTLVHRAIELANDLPAARAILEKFLQGLGRGKDKERIMNELDPMLVSYYQNEIIQPLIRDNKVQKEVPFLAHINQHTYIRGVIDQLCISPNRVIIADLKTNVINNDRQLEEKTRQYSVQLNVYQEAVQKILELQDADKMLFFLRTDQVIKVPSANVNMELSENSCTTNCDGCKKCGYYKLCKSSTQINIA